MSTPPLHNEEKLVQEGVPVAADVDNHVGVERPKLSQVEAVPLIHCRESGLDHTSLVAFGIQKCPKCNDIIQNSDDIAYQTTSAIPTAMRSVETKTMTDPDASQEVLDLLKRLNKGVESMAVAAERWTERNDILKAQWEEEQERRKKQGAQSNNKEGSASGLTVDNLIHAIEFRDKDDLMVIREERQESLGANELRQRSTEGEIAIITNTIRTNIPPTAAYRLGPPGELSERDKIIKAGILGNPDVEFTSIEQSMHLKSVPVIKILERVVKYYPGLTLQRQGVVLDAPYHVLAHHMPELEKFRDSFIPKVATIARLKEDNGVTTPKIGSASQDAGDDENSEVTLRHVDKILEFMRSGNIYSQQLEEERSRHRLDPPLCTFPMLWLLYKPGTTVYISSSAGVEAFVVSKVEAEASLSEQANFLMNPATITLDLWHLTFDGMFVRRREEFEVIGSFDGSRPIADLKVVPAEFADKADGGKTRERLVELGRKWYSLLSGAPQQHYVGETMSPGRKIKVSNSKILLS